VGGRVRRPGHQRVVLELPAGRRLAVRRARCAAPTANPDRRLCEVCAGGRRGPTRARQSCLTSTGTRCLARQRARPLRARAGPGQRRRRACRRGASRAGWGNGELEWYTSAPANARVAGGALMLTALRNDSGRAFTSARLRTAGLRDFVPAGPQQLLRLEARVQLPQGAPRRVPQHALRTLRTAPQGAVELCTRTHMTTPLRAPALLRAPLSGAHLTGPSAQGATASGRRCGCCPRLRGSRPPERGPAPPRTCPAGLRTAPGRPRARSTSWRRAPRGLRPLLMGRSWRELVEGCSGR